MKKRYLPAIALLLASCGDDWKGDGKITAHVFRAAYTEHIAGWMQMLSISTGKTTTVVPIWHPDQYVDHPDGFWFDVLDGNKKPHRIGVSSVMFNQCPDGATVNAAKTECRFR